MNQRTDMTVCSALLSMLYTLYSLLLLGTGFGTVFWVGFMLFFFVKFSGAGSEFRGSGFQWSGTWDLGLKSNKLFEI